MQAEEKALRGDYQKYCRFSELHREIGQAKKDLLRNIEEHDYDHSSELVDSVLNERVAESAASLSGASYVLGGEPKLIDILGGLDCADISEYAGEEGGIPETIDKLVGRESRKVGVGKGI